MRTAFVSALLIITLSTMSSCSVRADRAAPQYVPPKGTVDYELPRVEFQRGRPQASETFEESAAPPAADQVKRLMVSVRFLEDVPQVGVEIIGSTDTQECKGAECRELSIRRARCVYLWLVGHGISASRLRGPKGDGSDYPIGSNDSEEGRQSNRRVQLELMPLE